MRTFSDHSIWSLHTEQTIIVSAQSSVKHLVLIDHTATKSTEQVYMRELIADQSHLLRRVSVVQSVMTENKSK